MIGKVVGYGGFKSYSQCPYPTTKQGKQVQTANQIWQVTKREADKVNPLQNYNHYHTNYKKNHLENTQPKDYHPEHVPKGASSSLNFAGNSLSKPYDRQEAETAGQPGYKTGFNMLNTGTQHWKTNYQGSVCEPAGRSNISQLQSSKRAQSGKKLANGLIDEQLSKAMSYKNRPYINDIKLGVTDYKFNYGEKIGADPKQILNVSSGQQPIRDHPLKYGTNQLWSEIPGYLGFKPSQVPFSQLKSKIEQRGQVSRGDKKLLLGQNYHVNVPGYGGYKPRINVGASQARESCFQYRRQ